MTIPSLAAVASSSQGQVQAVDGGDEGAGRWTELGFFLLTFDLVPPWGPKVWMTWTHNNIICLAGQPSTNTWHRLTTGLVRRCVCVCPHNKFYTWASAVSGLDFEWSVKNVIWHQLAPIGRRVLVFWFCVESSIVSQMNASRQPTPSGVRVLIIPWLFTWTHDINCDLCLWESWCFASSWLVNEQGMRIDLPKTCVSNRNCGPIRPTLWWPNV